jgi:hypothetical protein
MAGSEIKTKKRRSEMDSFTSLSVQQMESGVNTIFEQHLHEHDKIMSQKAIDAEVEYVDLTFEELKLMDDSF